MAKSLKKYCFDKYGTKYHYINDSIMNTIVSEGDFGEDNKKIFELYHNICSNINNKKKGVVLDIGANIGSFCLPLAKKYPHITFYAFELQKYIFLILEKNIKINNLKNIKAFNVGISNVNKKIYLNIPDYKKEMYLGSFSLEKNILHHRKVAHYNQIKEEATLKTLDSFSFKKVDFIKSDTEMHELHVFEGAQKTIKKNNPFLIFESWPKNRTFAKKQNLHELKIQRLLKKCNYQYFRGYRETIAIHKNLSEKNNFEIVLFFFKKSALCDEIDFKYRYTGSLELLKKLLNQSAKNISWRIAKALKILGEKIF